MGCRRCGCDKPRVKYTDGMCTSQAACTKRLRERVGVRLVLEGLATAQTDEVARIAREIRNTLYRHGLCVDCGTVPYSAGRPRCNRCHAELLKRRTTGEALP